MLFAIKRTTDKKYLQKESSDSGKWVTDLDDTTVYKANEVSQRIALYASRFHNTHCDVFQPYVEIVCIVDSDEQDEQDELTPLNEDVPPAEAEPGKQLKCPKCSGTMVQRVSKYGPFYGCRDYPKCTGKRNAKGRA